MWITRLISIVIFPYFTTDTINMGASFCGPAADYGAETVMWELHTLTVILDFAERKVVTSQDVN